MTQDDRLLAHAVVMKVLGDTCTPERYEAAVPVAEAAVAEFRADLARQKADAAVLAFRKAAGIPMRFPCCCVGCPHERNCRCKCPVCAAELLLEKVRASPAGG